MNDEMPNSVFFALHTIQALTPAEREQYGVYNEADIDIARKQGRREIIDWLNAESAKLYDAAHAERYTPWRANMMAAAHVLRMRAETALESTEMKEHKHD